MALLGVKKLILLDINLTALTETKDLVLDAIAKRNRALKAAGKPRLDVKINQLPELRAKKMYATTAVTEPPLVLGLSKWPTYL